MILKKFIIAFIACCLFVACKQKYAGFEQNDNGLFYQFHLQNENAVKPANGDIVVLSMNIHTESDSIIEPTKSISTMMQSPKFSGDIFDALAMMHKGDSATFIINAKQYYQIYNYGHIPDFVNDKTMLWFTFCIHDIYNYQEYQQSLLEKANSIEKEQIETYLLENNITIEPRESGLIYIETKTGKGAFAQVGSTCIMNYTGKFLDGTIFDSSVERNQPFSFVLGQGQVIKGWDEGIALMKKGGKATLIIPSALAYGERGAGGGSIPPHTPLIFDVELIDFK